MDATLQGSSPSKGSIWTGRVLSILVILLLALDAVLKFLKPPPVAEAFLHLGSRERVTGLEPATFCLGIRSSSVFPPYTQPRPTARNLVYQRERTCSTSPTAR